MGYEQEHERREKEMDELGRMAYNFAQHNYELKKLILQYGDDKMKSRLEKLMEKYSCAEGKYGHDGPAYPHWTGF